MSTGGASNGFLVERYSPGVSHERIAALADRTRAAASQGRRRVDPAIPAGGTVFWLFEGPEDAVRAVAREAGLTCERILQSRRIESSKRMREEQ
jgi:hypothetical protein